MRGKPSVTRPFLYCWCHLENTTEWWRQLLVRKYDVHTKMFTEI